MNKKITILLAITISQTGYGMLKPVNHQSVNLKIEKIDGIAYTQYNDLIPKRSHYQVVVDRSKTFKKRKRTCPCSPTGTTGCSCDDVSYCHEKVVECPSECSSRFIDDFKPCGQHSSKICCIGCCASIGVCFAGFFITFIVVAALGK